MAAIYAVVLSRAVLIQIFGNETSRLGEPNEATGRGDPRMPEFVGPSACSEAEDAIHEWRFKGNCCGLRVMDTLEPKPPNVIQIGEHRTGARFPATFRCFSVA